MPEALVEPKPAHTADPSLYLNRDLSLLAFQERILEEAKDPSIACSNARSFSQFCFRTWTSFSWFEWLGSNRARERNNRGRAGLHASLGNSAEDSRLGK